MYYNLRKEVDYFMLESEVSKQITTPLAAPAFPRDHIDFIIENI